MTESQARNVRMIRDVKVLPDDWVDLRQACWNLKDRADQPSWSWRYGMELLALRRLFEDD
jgi:hypothetical protein